LTGTEKLDTVQMNPKMKTLTLLPLLLLPVAVLIIPITNHAQSVTKIAAGGTHSLFLKSDGSLWAMGEDFYGELGDGTYSTASPYGTNQPEKVIPSNVTAICAGGLYSFILKSDESLWGMGYNNFGQLGDGTQNSTNRPEQIASGNITAIATAHDFSGGYSLFISNNGSVWAMGYNQYGQFGNGNYTSSNSPQQTVPSNVTAVAAGQRHSLFLKSDGSLWAVGDDFYGQLGNGIFTLRTNMPAQIVPNNVTAIAAGQNHSLFLKSDGSLWAMGQNIYGQLGEGPTNSVNLPEQIVASNVTAIAAGYNHSMFIKNDGSLWVMGYNFAGQLGDGTTNNSVLPEQIVPSGVTAIAGGLGHSLFIKSDGSLWGMGYNADGELGDGTFNNTNRPEQILAGVFGYNMISGQLLGAGGVRLSFTGNAGVNYALDRSFNLFPSNWQPLATNPAGTDGVLIFTNTPNSTTNNFWRIRSVP
jgi:alpha-tubulin suppressor-like RCC1 family protein